MTCKACTGAGEVDSGGVGPSNEPISVTCPYCVQRRNPDEVWVHSEIILLDGRVIKEWYFWYQFGGVVARSVDGKCEFLDESIRNAGWWPVDFEQPFETVEAIS